MVEAIKTEKYDYSKEVRKAERVYMKLDKLSTGQLLKVHDFIEQIKEAPADDELRVRDWFNQQCWKLQRKEDPLLLPKFQTLIPLMWKNKAEY